MNGFKEVSEILANDTKSIFWFEINNEGCVGNNTWTHSHLSFLGNLFCNLKITCTVIIKLFSREKNLLTNILS